MEIQEKNIPPLVLALYLTHANERSLSYITTSGFSRPSRFAVLLDRDYTIFIQWFRIFRLMQFKNSKIFSALWITKKHFHSFTSILRKVIKNSLKLISLILISPKLVGKILFLTQVIIKQALRTEPSKLQSCKSIIGKTLFESKNDRTPYIRCISNLIFNVVEKCNA